MSRRFIVSITMFFVLGIVVLGAVLFGPDLLSPEANIKYSQPAIASRNIIMSENAHLGTASWEIPNGKEASTQIQAYAGATSVQPEHKLPFYVSVQENNTPFSINIYRLGWYGGFGGRLMGSWANQVGHAQGYY